MQVGRVAGCFRRSGGSGAKGAASVVVGDLSLPTWRCPPISGGDRERRPCFREARRDATLQPVRQGDPSPSRTCFYKEFVCESRLALALRFADMPYALCQYI